MNWSDFPISIKLRINFALFILFFLCFSCVTLYGFSRVKGLFAKVKMDSVPVIVAVLESKNAANRLFAEIQGFAATGNEDEIIEFQESVETIGSWMDKWRIHDNCSCGLSLKTAMENHRDIVLRSGKSIFTVWTERQVQVEAFTELGSRLDREIEKVLAASSDKAAQKELATLGRAIDLLQIETYRLLSMSTAGDNEEDEGAEKAGEDRQEQRLHGGADDKEVAACQKRLASVYGSLETARASWAVSGLATGLPALLEKIVNSSKGIVEKTAVLGELLEKLEGYEEEILGVLDEAVLHHVQEADEAFHKAASVMSMYTLFLAVTGVIFTCIALLLFHLTASSIITPLIRLMDMVRIIAGGDLSKRIEHTGKDEVGQLGHYFNKMTEQLEKTTVSRQYLDNILSNMTESLIVLSPGGRIETVNTATRTLLGYQREELLGEDIRPLLLTASVTGKQKRVQEHLLQEIEQVQHARKNAVQGVEAHYYTRKGRAIPVLFSCSAVSGREGNEQGIVCVAADITRLKKIQQELKDSYSSLQRVQDQLIQSSKLASIGELAAGVAHELNQPLMIIRTGSQILERKRKNGPIDEQQLDKHLESILSNSKRMMNIIDHLRTFSRQSSMSFSPVHINKVLENCFYMIGEQLRLRDISIRKELEADLPVINGDANQIEQVILNVLTNARDALEDKSAAADKADGGQKEITLITRISPEDPSMVELLVRDSGSGIPADKKDKIFDPFFTTKEEGKGTGLGLSVSYGIIQDHKGIIDIAETSNLGTTFRIRLPVTPQTGKGKE